MQARVEKLKAAQLARKASAGAALLYGSSGEAAVTLVGECASIVDGTGADAVCVFSSWDQPGVSSFYSGIPETYASKGAEALVDALRDSEVPYAN